MACCRRSSRSSPTDWSRHGCLAAGRRALEAVAREHPELADQAYLLATDLGDLALLQQMAGKLDSALKSVRRAIEVFERLDRSTRASSTIGAGWPAPTT